MQTTNIEQRIKADLWRSFGTNKRPAEWDGRNFGGGKLSQRYWEYFKAVEMLDLDEHSILLDIGGGSPRTGLGFFAHLVRPYVRRVIVVDPNVFENVPLIDNVSVYREAATPRFLERLLETNLNITHIVSISVLEHIEDQMRRDMISVINEWFNGSAFVSTFEFHARTCHFESQLTSASVSELFKPFTHFYLSRLESSPVFCENSFDDKLQIPRWYPLAVKFERFMN
jgi:hypothetical protein